MFDMTYLATTRSTQQVVVALFMLAAIFCVAPRVSGQGPAKPGVPPGFMIIEGDIIVPKDFFSKDLPWAVNLWPGGIVPFEFDGNVSASNRTAMRNAMAVLENVAYIDFRARQQADKYFLHIQDSTRNRAVLGRSSAGQLVEIASWNRRFVMVHELLHALGSWHEQSHPDRDKFVRINKENIIPEELYNFDKHPDAGTYGSYDFDSVMHYGQFFWSSNRQPTITVLPPNQQWQSRIGQRTHLSRLDTLTISFLYPFPNWRFVDGGFPGNTERGTFLEPYRQFLVGVQATPTNGTLWIQPGVYRETGTLNRAMDIRAPLGGVTIGR